MQTAVVDTSKWLIKLSKNPFGQWCDLVEEIRVSTKETQVEAIPEVGKFVDYGKIEELQGSALVMFYCCKNLSEFKRRQKELQEAYGNEARTLDIIYDELREIENEGNSITDNKLRGRPRLKKQ